MKVLITSYPNPDLDGTACTFAYSEFLQKKGEDVIAGIFNKIHQEAQYVFDKFEIKPINKAESLIADANEIILVDTSDLKGISNEVNPEKVIEIIDHRKIHEANKFSNAKAQIELVGSCATLIAEKYYQEEIEISKESAILLYSAIVSNTINFKNKVTTERDIKMAEWLKMKLNLPENYIHEMFAKKSKFTQPIKETILGDFKEVEFKEKSIGIAQLEIVDVNEFINHNLKELTEILSELKKDQTLDFIFLSCIDLEKGFNVFISNDKETKELLEKLLEIKFEDNVAKKEGIIMRKELIPILKEYLFR